MFLCCVVMEDHVGCDEETVDDIEGDTQPDQGGVEDLAPNEQVRNTIVCLFMYTICLF